MILKNSFLGTSDIRIVFKPDGTHEEHFAKYLQKYSFSSPKISASASVVEPRFVISGMFQIQIIKLCSRCMTVTNKPCVFPFKWRGVTHVACTTAGGYSPWCSTLVNGLGMHVKGNYADCGDSCPVETECKTTQGKRCVFPFSIRGKHLSSFMMFKMIERNSLQWMYKVYLSSNSMVLHRD